MISQLGAIWDAIRLPADERSLKQKVLLSGVLSVSGFVLNITFRLVSTIVLTRLLAPEIFGVFSVLLSVLFILTMFTDLGVRSLILTREEEIDPAFLQSCWTMQLLRGVLVGCIIVLIALLIGLLQTHEVFKSDSSYAEPVLPAAITVSAISFLILSAESPNKFVYERQMAFGRITAAAALQEILALASFLGLAFLLKNIWALVLGEIIKSCLRVILSKVMFKGPKMRLSWHKPYISIIWDRGKWIVTHSALNALTSIADRLILGAYLPASNFGFYHIARQLIDMPLMLLNRIHAQVGLQVFSEIHKSDATDTFKIKYYRYRIFFDTLSMLGCGMLYMLAPLIIQIVYDDRYFGVAYILQILSLGLPLSGFVILREAYSARRQFRKMTSLSIIQAVSIWLGLSLALPVFGSITAAFFVIAFHRIPEILALLSMGYREGWVSWWREVRFLPLIIVGLILGLALDTGLRWILH